MKWVLFAIALAGLLPLTGWLRQNPLQRPKIWMLMGCLPFLLTALPRLEIGLIAWPLWPGIARGIEVSALDVLALAIYLSLPRGGEPLPFKVAMGFYLAAVLLSAIQAIVPIATIFYVWQLARVFLVYAVVTKACGDERVAPSLLKGMAIGLCFEACVVTWDRFHLGVVQASGTFGHQNLLGLVSHFAFFPFFALLLAGERGWWPSATSLAGGVIAALSASRATIGLVGLGLAVLFILSSARRWTAQKARIALFATAAVFVIGLVAASSLERRFATDPLSDYDERAALVSASARMLSDFPMGVGANNFGLVNNTLGYAEEAEIAWTSRAAIVHNIYWLALAETGYLGFLALVILLIRPLFVAFRCSWRNRRDERGDLLIGFGTSLLIIYIHSYFEWVLFTTQVQYIFAMTIGMVAGIAQQLGYWRTAKVGAFGHHAARDRADRPAKAFTS